MTRREGRYQYQSEARQPRMVDVSMRERCMWARHKRREELSEAEFVALGVIVDAWANMERVTKADIDRASGILGRLNANG